MSKILGATLTVFLLGTAATASAADPADQLTPMQRYEAACSKAGFQQGEVNFQDCVSTLRQTARSMVTTMKGSMCTKACTLAGLQPGSDQFDACVSKLNTGITDDARDNG